MSWSSSEAIQIIRELLQSLLPHPVHDYIVEGVCQALSGQHVLAVVRTGGGKTGYFYCYMLVLQALSHLPHTHSILSKKFWGMKIPKKPQMVIVYPTKGLAEEMESTLRRLSLSALAINEDTLAAARRREEDLWETAKSVAMILLSPEQLVSPRFNRLLHDKNFSKSVCALGIDEMHLIHDWGHSGFRKAFTDMGLVFARMRPSTRLIAVTATLPAIDITSITKTLGLKAGSYKFTRRSNIRHDVKLIVQTLRHGLNGWSFPDLRWIIEGSRKTIIYGDTISLIFRLLVYLWHEATADPLREQRFRMYTALCSQEYNTETRQLFELDSRCQVVLATDAAKVGNDWSCISDAVIFNPKNPNDVVQKAGRVGRRWGTVESPRAIVYFTKAQMEKARKHLTAQASGSNRSKKGKTDTVKADEWLTDDMAHIMTASCTTTELNRIYDNPQVDPPCSCDSCKASTQLACNCGGCNPEVLPSPPPHKVNPQRKHKTMGTSLSNDMQSQVRQQLKTWQFKQWLTASDERIKNMPPDSLLPSSVVDDIVSHFMSLKDEDLKLFLSRCISPLDDYTVSLSSLISELRAGFAKELHRDGPPTAPAANRSQGVSPSINDHARLYHFPPTGYDVFMTSLRSLQAASMPPKVTEALRCQDILTPVSPNIPPTSAKRKASPEPIGRITRSRTKQKEN